MAKDQFKAKTKARLVSNRFGVMPLIDKGEEFLCVDANYNFLMIRKERIEMMAQIALPETYDAALYEKAKEAAKTYLPTDQKKFDLLVFFLKNTGATGFGDYYTKIMG